jgi:hypothetical protein
MGTSNKEQSKNYSYVWDIICFLIVILLFNYTSEHYEEMIHFKPETSTNAMVFSFFIRFLDAHGGRISVYGFYCVLMFFFIVNAFRKYEKNKED